MKTVEAFIARRRDMGLQGKIHIIWVCIPLDDERPVLRLFDLATGDVPVIGVFTKYDALETQALNNLRRQGRRKRNAFREMPEEAERLFQTNWLPLIMGGKYPPVAHVCLKNLDKSTGNCDDLRERTYEILRRRRVIMSPLEGRPNIVVEGTLNPPLEHTNSNEGDSSASLRLSMSDAYLVNISQPITNDGLYDLFFGTHIPTSQKLALKRPRLSTQTAFEIASSAQRFVQEANKWLTLKHDNIFPLYGMVEISYEVYLVSPWMEYGNLSGFLAERLSFLDGDTDDPNNDSKKITYMDFRESDVIHRIASGLAYLHAQSIVHGDLKASNILLTEQLKPMISDFGTTEMHDNQRMAFTPMNGIPSLRWMSPEVIDGGPKTIESDIYAFGMIIVEAILDGERPIFEPTSRLDRNFAPMWSIASACWVSDPSKRPTAQILYAETSVSLRLSTSDTHLIVMTEPNRSVGGGGFCDLFLGKYLPSGQVLGMKRPRLSVQTASEIANVTRRFSREAKTWSSLTHDNILPFYGLVEISSVLYLVSPWMEYGSLSRFLTGRLSFLGTDPRDQDNDPNRTVYNDFKEADTIYGIASGLAYLHIKRIVHGDLKTLNILLDKQLNPLICDFGITKMKDINVTSTAMKGAGSTRWMSPEVMDGGTTTIESDIYAFGMTIVEVLTGSFPLPSLHHVQFVLAILAGQRPHCEPTSRLDHDFTPLWGIASMCWVPEPSERPSAGHILEIMERAIPTATLARS
ncbi:hypothetical protein FRB94_006976 [Tulasnella sp. JGI-2019a]|nr:hypothetical protein FRB94_006976 [Tulasnella sp. JGI-2019a]